MTTIRQTEYHTTKSPFQSQPSNGDDDYPKYRQRSPHDGGFKAAVRNHEIDKVDSTLQYTNKLFLKIYDAHINVELCTSVKSIKYVTKYINKGRGQVTFTSIHLTNWNNFDLVAAFVVQKRFSELCLLIYTNEQKILLIFLIIYFTDTQILLWLPSDKMYNLVSFLF